MVSVSRFYMDVDARATLFHLDLPYSSSLFEKSSFFIRICRFIPIECHLKVSGFHGPMCRCFSWSSRCCWDRLLLNHRGLLLNVGLMHNLLNRLLRDVDHLSLGCSSRFFSRIDKAQECESYQTATPESTNCTGCVITCII
ncbi:MAG: Uncharacterised protein [Marine Group II euryarchaeote MED-G33]|nr:MAG: Uncharacterised protein [Marine Group II euryarchaeote MED-G33]